MIRLCIATLLIALVIVAGCDRPETKSEKHSRVVEVTDLTDAKSIEDIGRELKRIDDRNSSMAIMIEINSDGGLAWETLNLAATIRSLKSPIHTHTTTGAHSGAAILVAAGTPGHRTADPNSMFSFMGIQLAEEFPDDMERKLRLVIRNRLDTIFGADASSIETALNSNRVYDPDQAVGAGIIDVVRAVQRKQN